MNTNSTNPNHVSKQLEYVKQQEQLRALGNSKNNPKPLSADSMIENLLSKKETFQKRSSEPQQKQEVTGWLGGTVPPMYSQVWTSVQSANGLADTPTLSSLLLSSGLPTDTLAYIWSLANRTVPGSLTQQEVYLVLALVALTQSGYHVTNLATVLHLPQAPIPSLDLALLPQRQQFYPSPLSVEGLADPLTYNWVAPETQVSNVTDKINVSYVSSGPMVSPKLLTENPPSVANFSFTDFNINSGSELMSDSVPNSSVIVDTGNKSSHTKRSGNTYTFSFPSLNESPSHIANANSEVVDSFDDEFTDFQSADFNSVSSTMPVENHENTVVEDDEFSNFQKASPKFDDDLSVLVIDGKNIPSAQSLWVADNPVASKRENFDVKPQNTTVIGNQNLFTINTNTRTEIKKDGISEKIEKNKNKYDIFQEIDDDRFSVFHNPLPDDEDKHIVSKENTIENIQFETKSIFNHSLFNDTEQSSDLFRTRLDPVSMDIPKANVLSSDSNDLYNRVDMGENDDDEFSTFQNFPVSFPDPSQPPQEQNLDKYDVFRTIVFTDNSPNDNSSQEARPQEKQPENVLPVNLFEAEMDLFNIPGHNAKEQENESIHNLTGKAIEDIKFDHFHASAMTPTENSSNNIDNLFSSLAISDKTNDLGTINNSTLDVGVVEDKYKALRLLEENPNEADDFGEFLVADVPNTGSQPPKLADKPSIQVRCLEACLTLLRDGLTTLSRASSQDVVSEVLGDPRASTYLDCLLEVHRVAERIMSNMEKDVCVSTKAELQQVWERLGPYFTHTEHNHLTETVSAQCGVCRSSTGPSPVTFGAMTFHSPCANLYLHCVEPVLPNISSTPLVS